jgi:poly(3-hydroxybutyrate) depolymerase
VREHRWLIATLVAAVLASCGGSSDSATTEVPREPADDRRVLRDVEVGGRETHVFLPAFRETDGGAVPVVIMLHGTAADRTILEPLAVEVAETGALVYLPTWPVIDQVRRSPRTRGMSRTAGSRRR